MNSMSNTSEEDEALAQLRLEILRSMRQRRQEKHKSSESAAKNCYDTDIDDAQAFKAAAMRSVSKIAKQAGGATVPPPNIRASLSYSSRHGTPFVNYNPLVWQPYAFSPAPSTSHTRLPHPAYDHRWDSNSPAKQVFSPSDSVKHSARSSNLITIQPSDQPKPTSSLTTTPIKAEDKWSRCEKKEESDEDDDIKEDASSSASSSDQSETIEDSLVEASSSIDVDLSSALKRADKNLLSPTKADITDAVSPQPEITPNLVNGSSTNDTFREPSQIMPSSTAVVNHNKIEVDSNEARLMDVQSFVERNVSVGSTSDLPSEIDLPNSSKFEGLDKFKRRRQSSSSSSSSGSSSPEIRRRGPLRSPSPKVRLEAGKSDLLDASTSQQNVIDSSFDASALTSPSLEANFAANPVVDNSGVGDTGSTEATKDEQPSLDETAAAMDNNSDVEVPFVAVLPSSDSQSDSDQEGRFKKTSAAAGANKDRQRYSASDRDTSRRSAVHRKRRERNESHSSSSSRSASRSAPRRRRSRSGRRSPRGSGRYGGGAAASRRSRDDSRRRSRSRHRDERSRRPLPPPPSNRRSGSHHHASPVPLALFNYRPTEPSKSEKARPPQHSSGKASQRSRSRDRRGLPPKRSRSRERTHRSLAPFAAPQQHQQHEKQPPTAKLPSLFSIDTSDCKLMSVLPPDMSVAVKPTASKTAVTVPAEQKPLPPVKSVLVSHKAVETGKNEKAQAVRESSPLAPLTRVEERCASEVSTSALPEEGHRKQLLSASTDLREMLRAKFMANGQGTTSNQDSIATPQNATDESQSCQGRLKPAPSGIAANRTVVLPSNKDSKQKDSRHIQTKPTDVESSPSTAKTSASSRVVVYNSQPRLSDVRITAKSPPKVSNSDAKPETANAQVSRKVKLKKPI